MMPPPPPTAQRLVATSREAGTYRPPRKSVAAGLPGRVPGSEPWQAEADPRGGAPDRSRRKSVMPQRVPEPATPASSSGSAASGRGGGGEAAQRLPLAAAGEQGQTPHLSRPTSASDDIGHIVGGGSRDQQLDLAAGAVAAAAARTGSGSLISVGDQQQTYAARSRGGARAGGAAGAGAAAAAARQPQGASQDATGHAEVAGRVPPSLVKAVAAIMAVPRTWNEKVERFNNLAEVLARQASPAHAHALPLPGLPAPCPVAGAGLAGCWLLAAAAAAAPRASCPPPGALPASPLPRAPHC
jgi:hypothetical protein